MPKIKHAYSLPGRKHHQHPHQYGSRALRRTWIPPEQLGITTQTAQKTVEDWPADCNPRDEGPSKEVHLQEGIPEGEPDNFGDSGQNLPQNIPIFNADACFANQTLGQHPLHQPGKPLLNLQLVACFQRLVCGEYRAQ